MKIFTFLTAAALVLISCSSKSEKQTYEVKNINGTDTYINSAPSNPCFSYKFKEILKINGEDPQSDKPERNFYSSSNIAVDSKNNIFLVGDKSNTIKKFDPNGNFVKSFGRTGKGPGEYTQAKNMVILKDTLFISDPYSFKIIKLNAEGEYLSERQMTNRTPEFLLPLKNGEGFIGTDLRAEAEEKVYLISSVSKFNCSFDKILDYSTVKMEFDPGNPKLNPMDFMAIYTGGENFVYIAEISEDKYQITVKDFEGKNKFNIMKGYRKVKLTPEELKKLGDQVHVSSHEGEIAKNTATDQFNKAVHGLWTDKYGRLWVLPSRDKKDENDKELHFDIFENGVYLNTFIPDFYKDDTDFGMNVKIKFMNGRMYLIDNSVEDICIRVFEY